MYCGKRTCRWVANQDWHTVGSLNPSKHAWRIANNRVTVNSISSRILGGFGILRVLNEAHVGAVHLPTACQCPFAREELEKAATILQNVLRRIFVKAGKIQRILGHPANATHACGETINETILFQWRANQSEHAVNVAPVKPGVL
jgi:hypothetical protein